MRRILIKGPIITNGEKWLYDWFGMDATCPNDIDLPGDGSDITVMINSGGGYVHVGNEIYTMLKQYAGHVTIDIIEACSAASVIAMAGNTVRCTPTGQIMIHNVSSYTEGDYRDMEHAAEVLQKANESICAAYELKTGKSREELLAMMDRETWMTAEEAKEMGFVDEILFQEEKPLKLVANCESLLPDNVVSVLQAHKGQLSGETFDTEALTNAIAEKVVLKLQTEPQNHKNPKSDSNPLSRFAF